jgi:Zn ribbon nucleic-acid-binding protein
MPNYSNSKIYKIINVENENDNFIYIGSTTRPLNVRIASHRSDSKKSPNRKLYKHILENGGWLNFKIVLIESYVCNSKEELFARENYWQKQLNTVKDGLNTFSAVLDVENLKEKNRIHKREIYKNNKEIIKNKIDQYYKNNKMKVSERLKQYRNNNKFKYSCALCGYHSHAKDKIARHINNQKHQANLSIYNFIHS